MELASNFSLLHAKLSKLGFRDWDSVSEGDVMTGNPHTYSLFLQFLYHRFPAATAALIRKHDWFILEHSDENVGAATVRLLAAETGEVHGISGAQFGRCKYASAKVAMCHSLLRLLRSLTPQPSTERHPARVPIASRSPMSACKPAAALPAQPFAAALVDKRRRALNSLQRS
ncbi:hypothetical protein conserved [Leishmania donovani]|uniref:Uncharacterized protein n=3 Tax=Leishmania donovani species complex TaxID=38574 RepID=A4I147_LEIIN|nr:conserved hypothetical protein [Leishmania infantum JPCM5]CAC9493151.1 hypothetical_protein_-_conserved [Leishmania infantum]CAJ1989325.1 hypothetical protein conserved [Leishmania donovani]CAM68473.1 conserved hypothetical protein [Leishmania infantum JPCM5]SUZ42326.1 hypothetical_protein_-_conserved [Leishmania infantum]VDZ45192.1 hypothetical_protein_conserved [Leishmania donovani]|eukprot:XP_001466038.1 conserved hypothetical protein [Leishmania infantum JPCM5]